MAISCAQLHFTEPSLEARRLLWHVLSIGSVCRNEPERDQHYVAPMCTPTRVSLLTGRYASRFGVTSAQNERALPWNTLTLAGALKNSGYTTALVGKWHLGSKPEWGPRQFGFDFSYGSLGGATGPYDHRYRACPISPCSTFPGRAGFLHVQHANADRSNHR